MHGGLCGGGWVTGQQRKQTAFLFTESEIKDEVFLELINSILMTGEVSTPCPPSLCLAGDRSLTWVSMLAIYMAP